ncbi:hypothetical protein, unlikely [Trypanosoma congolense IL3000]|uniref:Uncharacterized protein n=1 Tax=Trypanosoma congolense (strain IL3000) TaxID=1068625 RepID=F9WFS7_TRYCI|nr:hypothetical protein, unlikely [Trypanosoma congolense IL3000]
MVWLASSYSRSLYCCAWMAVLIKFSALPRSYRLFVLFSSKSCRISSTERSTCFLFISTSWYPPFVIFQISVTPLPSTFSSRFCMSHSFPRVSGLSLHKRSPVCSPFACLPNNTNATTTTTAKTQPRIP